MSEYKQVNTDAAERITPSGDIQVITPNDSTEFDHPTKGIIMSTANDGTLSAVGSNRQAVAIPIGTLTTGVLYPLELIKINNTNTTATAVICLF
jgi:hypothetical protein